MATISIDFDSPDLPTAIVLTALSRTDTDEAVDLPVPPDFTDEGDGTWSITFDELAVGLTYAYTATVTWEDTSESTFSDTYDTSTATDYTGRYTDSDELRIFMAAVNKTIQGDVDGDGLEDPGASRQAIRSGEADMDVVLGGPVTEFAAGDDGESAADLLNGVAVAVSAYKLSTKRGFSQAAQNEYLRVRDEAMVLLEKFAANPYGITITSNGVAEIGAGRFQFVTINRGTTCTEDEFSSG